MLDRLKKLLHEQLKLPDHSNPQMRAVVAWLTRIKIEAFQDAIRKHEESDGSA